MIKIGDYTIEEYPKSNKLVITVPQLLETATSSTMSVTCSRKRELSKMEQSIILTAVKSLYEGKYS